MSAQHRIKNAQKTPKQNKNEFYPTKQVFADYHMEMLFNRNFIYEGASILDVGIGEGVYGKAVRKYSKNKFTLTGIEIDSKMSSSPSNKSVYDNILLADFKDYNFNVGFDFVIGNPPYSDIQETVEKSLSILNYGGVLSFLLKGSFVESEKRFKELFSKNRPFEIWNCVLRPIKGHFELYTVFNFQRMPLPTTTAHWIYAKNEKTFDFI